MKLVYGFGVNDADYVTQPTVSGKRVMCPAYQAWTSMIRRSYSERLHNDHPTYQGVTVCSDWLSFMSFRSWWIKNNVKGWQLDKDLLTDSREYSPDSCIYVPSWLNSFTIDSGSTRGNCPIGVFWHIATKSYVAMCRDPVTGKRFHLGLFRDPDAAHKAWRSKKLNVALMLKSKMDEVDERIYPRVIEIIERAT